MTYNHIPKSLGLVELFRASVAKGFETLTMNAVKDMMEPKGFGEDLPPFMQMVEWHFVEELEHRTVTFDVYEHVFGDYLYRLFVGVWAQWHFSNWMRRVAAYMLEVRPQQKIDKTIDREEKLARVQPASVGNLLPGLLRIYLPNYTPHDVKISPGIQQLADKYTNMALETS